MSRRIDLARRAEIAAEKRTRTRAALLAVASELYGRDGGRATRIEEICERAGVARGTFYNYFPGIEALEAALFEELSNDFDDAIHAVFASLATEAERTATAVRYYVRRAMQDRSWGWAMVHTGMGTGLLTTDIASRVKDSIQAGMDAGEFNVPCAILGRDILLGSSLASTITLLKSDVPAEHPEAIAMQILMALGVSETRARKAVERPLPNLPL